MEYVDWQDLTGPQRQFVIAQYGADGIGLNWLRGHSFPVKKDGTIKVPMHPRISHRAAQKALAEMRNDYLGEVPARPEKGDIHHFKTAKFGLNREKP